MKRRVSVLPILAFCLLGMFSCARREGNVITVISREEGSGTRTAFIELFNVLDSEGRDNITLGAEISNGTSVVLAAVRANPSAISYLSMTSVSNDVKAIRIGGVEPTPQNVTNGTYQVSRSFIIATRTVGVTDVTQDFINFIMSSEGQSVVTTRGYIGVQEGIPFVSSLASGRVVAVGSTSVAPLMERLREAYLLINSNADVEIQQSGTSAGIRAAITGIGDIGMISRELRDSEIAEGLVPLTIAKDGISVIVHNGNSVDNLSKEQVRGIFLGEITDWSELE